jgi:hypothetical protein
MGAGRQRASPLLKPGIRAALPRWTRAINALYTAFEPSIRAVLL